MKYVLIGLGVLIALALLVTAVGAFMPREHVATSEITLRQPVDSVYAVLRDFGAIPSWWKDVKVSERVAGAPGERWRQEASGFEIQLDITNDTPPLGFVTRIVEEDGAPFGGEWTYVLAPLSEGTRVTITERGWVGPPPFRVMMALGGMHRTIDGMLTALGTRFGENVTPTHR